MFTEVFWREKYILSLRELKLDKSLKIVCKYRQNSVVALEK